MASASPPSTSSETTTNAVDEAEDASIKACLQEVDTTKQEGNELFRASKWEEALSTYRSALGRLPKRPQPPISAPHRNDPVEDLDVSDNAASSVGPPPSASTSASAPQIADSVSDFIPSTLGKWATEIAKTRATLNSNIAACFVKLGDNKEIINACNEGEAFVCHDNVVFLISIDPALKDDPSHIKALTRRAAANESLDTWTSLTAAREDYEKLLTLVPASETGKIRASLSTVKPRAEAAQKREMGEMMDKLKGLGNSILGNFGMSTDNFKFEPNGQGGYSVNFSR